MNGAGETFCIFLGIHGKAPDPFHTSISPDPRAAVYQFFFFVVCVDYNPFPSPRDTVALRKHVFFNNIIFLFRLLHIRVHVYSSSRVIPSSSTIAWTQRRRGIGMNIYCEFRAYPAMAGVSVDVLLVIFLCFPHSRRTFHQYSTAHNYIHNHYKYIHTILLPVHPLNCSRAPKP